MYSAEMFGFFELDEHNRTSEVASEVLALRHQGVRCYLPGYEERFILEPNDDTRLIQETVDLYRTDLAQRADTKKSIDDYTVLHNLAFICFNSGIGSFNYYGIDWKLQLVFVQPLSTAGGGNWASSKVWYQENYIESRKKVVGNKFNPEPAKFPALLAFNVLDLTWLRLKVELEFRYANHNIKAIAPNEYGDIWDESIVNVLTLIQKSRGYESFVYLWRNHCQLKELTRLGMSEYLCTYLKYRQEFRDECWEKHQGRYPWCPTINTPFLLL